MRHSFKLKKSQIKSIFLNKFEIKSVTVDKSEDVENVVNTFLVYNKLEDFLTPIQCSYNFFDGTVSFQLELDTDKDTSDFFKAIKKFETFVDA